MHNAASPSLASSAAAQARSSALSAPSTVRSPETTTCADAEIWIRRSTSRQLALKKPCVRLRCRSEIWMTVSGAMTRQSVGAERQRGDRDDAGFDIGHGDQRKSHGDLRALLPGVDDLVAQFRCAGSELLRHDRDLERLRCCIVVVPGLLGS